MPSCGGKIAEAISSCGGRKDWYCASCWNTSLPPVGATGMSSPAWIMPLNTVAAGAPVVQANIACAPAPLMRSICAATVRSDGLKCSRATSVIAPLFSGSAMSLSM